MRSLYLDNVVQTPDVVSTFESLGNTKVNEVYEKKLTASSSPPKLKPNDSREARTAFIQAKYADLLFKDPETPS